MGAWPKINQKLVLKEGRSVKRGIINMHRVWWKVVQKRRSRVVIQCTAIGVEHSGLLQLVVTMQVVSNTGSADHAPKERMDLV